MRRRIFDILEPAAEGDRLSRAFDIFIVALIAMNVLAIILESVQAVRERWSGWLWGFEIISVCVFTAEYLLRLWSCVEGRPGVSPHRTRLRFFVSPMGQVDLWAVMPFYLPFLGVDLRFIRAVRLFRLARIAKVGRYSKAVNLLGRVCWNHRAELVMALSVLLMLLILASTVIYYAENEVQPEAFSSVPASMWWTVATLTTVGYGDVYPITPLGKVMGSIISILGIGMFALPTGILGAGFVEEMQHKHRPPNCCPHCGKEIP